MKRCKSLLSFIRFVLTAFFCVVVVPAAVGACASAAGAGAHAGIMDRKEALEHALADAGLGASDVTITQQKLEKENGEPYYIIQFHSTENKYEYEISAYSGAVIGVNIQAYVNAPDSLSTEGSPDQTARPDPTAQPGTTVPPEASARPGTTVPPEASAQPGTTVPPEASARPETTVPPEASAQPETTVPPEASARPNQTVPPGQSGRIDLETAKAAALSDAGVNASDVVFTKSKTDWEDGIEVYEIEFYTASGEYEYEIKTADGSIFSKDIKIFPNQADSSGIQGAAGDYIGVEQAKTIAAANVGLDVSDVVFTKAKLDSYRERAKYEIEFRNGRMEYKYEIDAVTGEILKFDSEYDD